MKVKKLRNEMIQIYGNYCWMDNMWLPTPKNMLTYHHILERRNGGKAEWSNGALLSLYSHQYLNWLDLYYHKDYEELNGLFAELNRTYAPPTEDYYEEVKLVLKRRK